MNPRAVLLLTVTMIALAGCTVSVSGEPKSPEKSSTPPTSRTSDSKFAGLLPPRPRELDLAGVDPCADLLTERQLRDLNYDLGYARPPTPGRDDIHGGASCVFASNGGSGGVNRNVGTLITISTTEGALAWVNDPAREPSSRPEVASVEGFYALVLPHPKVPDDCLIVVDTANGQYLDVSSGASSGNGTGVETYCAEAERVAGFAIQTISASR